MFTSDGERYYIIGVARNNAGLYVRSCSSDSLKNDGTPRKDAQRFSTELKVTLDDCRAELWFTQDFSDFIEDL